MWKAVLLLSPLLLLQACRLPPVSSWVPGYLTDTRGNLLKGSDGRCWRTASWRPDLAIAECEPELAVVDPWKHLEEKPAPEESAKEAVADVKPEAATAAPEPGEIATVRRDEISHRTEVVFAPLKLESDISFPFDEATLTADARQRLGAFAARLRKSGVKALRVSVVGYSDRIGLEEYNLTLSQKRAESVRQALSGLGIPPSRIEARGVGETLASVRLEDCPDALSWRDLVACFAPDRRVEINASGQLPDHQEGAEAAQ